MYRTQPVPGLGGRTPAYPRGKVIGGSSAINAMLYMRGQAADYDGWRQMGLDGRGWDEVLPYFKQHEDHWLGANAAHGAGGEWHVDAARMRRDIPDAFAEAAVESGIPRSAGCNTGDNEGIACFEVNRKHGSRWSAARGFLKPVLDRPNPTLFARMQVRRILLENHRAAGVACAGREGPLVLTARRAAILSAGAVASPHILQQSGIGPGAVLQGAGIACA